MALPSSCKSPNLNPMAYSPLERLLSLPPSDHSLTTSILHTTHTLGILSRPKLSQSLARPLLI
ncbi:hypothetical protein AALA56_08845 [Streptococcus hyointestinalis]